MPARPALPELANSSAASTAMAGPVGKVTVGSGPPPIPTIRPPLAIMPRSAARLADRTSSRMTSTPLPSVSRLTSAATSAVVRSIGLVGAELADAGGVVGAADRGQHARPAGAGELHGGAADAARRRPGRARSRRRRATARRTRPYQAVEKASPRAAASSNELPAGLRTACTGRSGRTRRSCPRCRCRGR